MAYAALVSLKTTLRQTIFVRSAHQDSILGCEKHEFESFLQNLDFLQHQFLGSAAYNMNYETNSTARLLESRIRDAVYEAQDIIDVHFVSMDHSTEPAEYKKKNAVRSREYVTMLENADLKSVISRIDSIKQEICLMTEEGSLTVPVSDDAQPWARNSLRAKFGSDSRDAMVGFDDLWLQIKDQLSGESSSSLQAISIVGMGGMGKTTLAINTYNDPYVVAHFDIRAWVTVSQSYCTRNILLDLLNSMKMLSPAMNDEVDDELLCHIHKTLKGRRYLIAIDDIWDTDAWDAVRKAFPDDGHGSRILITTRITDVADYAASSSSSGGCLYRISPLSDDGSWNLLCNTVFGSKESCPFDLQEIGMNIALKCGGLPLAIVVIGGLLSKVNRTYQGWKSVEENITCLFSSSEDRCSEILKMSYRYLPQHLKSCFLYMAVFPEDYEINVSKLTKLWIAEGFLDGVCCSQRLEDVAERYLEELIDRSLISVCRMKRNGKMRTCKIHDLLLDLCVKEAECEKFLRITKVHPMESKPCLLLENLSCRRLSICAMGDEGFNIDFMALSSLVPMRSFIYAGTFRCTVRTFGFRKFDLLRVLDILNIKIPIDIPRAVWELMHLRFIALVLKTNIPESSSNLKNLQTLIVRYFGIGSKLRSNEIWQMAKLRHLEFVGYHVYLKDDHDGMKGSINFALHDGLQTLSKVMNLRFTTELMLRIPNIRKLDLSYNIKFEGRSSDFKLENMVNLHQLKHLKFRSSTLDNLSELKLPHSLETLSLEECRIPWKDLGSMVGTLPRLQVLKLKNFSCEGEEWPAPNESEFQELKVLVLKRVNLVEWNAEHNHFPALEQIVVENCLKLKGIPLGMGDSPTLAKIELSGYMSKSVLDSADEIEENQHNLGNYEFRLVKSMNLTPWEIQRSV